MKILLTLSGLFIFLFANGQNLDLADHFSNKPFSDEQIETHLYFVNDSSFVYALTDGLEKDLLDKAMGTFKVKKDVIYLTYSQTLIDDISSSSVDTINGKPYLVEQIQLPIYRYLRPSRLIIKGSVLRYNVFIETRRKNGKRGKFKIKHSLIPNNK
ncbi:MAG: hypothetical protein MJK07_16090 [Flavobacteriales bacterium]|nr:hypothetical protein [Flavobacteriales bacterium]